MTRVYWERLEANNHPPVGVQVLVFGYRSPDFDPNVRCNPEVGVDVLTSAPDGFDEFEAPSHWARLDDIDPPEVTA